MQKKISEMSEFEMRLITDWYYDNQNKAKLSAKEKAWYRLVHQKRIRMYKAPKVLIKFGQIYLLAHRRGKKNLGKAESALWQKAYEGGYE